jgi:hypothetical protein
MKKAERRSGSGCNENAQPKVASQIDGKPAGKGASRHDPFDAEIQNACSLTEEFSHGGKYQGRGNANCSGPQGGGGKDFDRLHFTSNASGNG